MVQILFVSQDSGSGNALFPIIKKLEENSHFNLIVFASSQSKIIYQQQGIEYVDLEGKHLSQELNRLKESINFIPDLIITGASGGKSIEKDAILYGKENNIQTISILDFWGNYHLRYSGVEENETLKFFPDIVFVMDQIGKKEMVEEGFPSEKIIITGNPYFDTFKLLKPPREHQILYVSQPLYHKGIFSLDKSLFNDFISIFLELKPSCKLIVRPHPKEKIDFYLDYLNQFDSLNFIVDDKTEIKELIKDSSIIFGKFSMVLFESAFSGKVVLSYQPYLIDSKLRDRLVTNELGLSKLIITKESLKNNLNHFLKNRPQMNNIGTIDFYNDHRSIERVVREINKIIGNL